MHKHIHHFLRWCLHTLLQYLKAIVNIAFLPLFRLFDVCVRVPGAGVHIFFPFFFLLYILHIEWSSFIKHEVFRIEFSLYGVDSGDKIKCNTITGWNVWACEVFQYDKMKVNVKVYSDGVTFSRIKPF